MVFPILVAAIGLASCLSAKNDSPESAKINVETNAASKLEILAISNEPVSVAIQHSIPKRETRSGYFNSEISVSFDGGGNKIENRYFKEDSRLSSLVLLTKTNGEKEIRIYGLNGQFSNLPSDIKIDVMTAPADEIADAAGIIKPVKFIPPPPQTTAQIEPVQTENLSISEPQAQNLQEQTTTAETTKSDPAVEAKSSPVQQAKQPVKESENKGSLDQF